MDSSKNKIMPTAAIQAAAMPSLYTSMPPTPQINILYLAPGQEIITPDQLSASNPEMLPNVGPQLAKLSPSVVVKYGTHASLIEAKNMLYIAERTSIPVPKLFAAYAYGPLDRDVGDYGSVYDTYIFMEFIEGEDLGKAWGGCTDAEKQVIATDLKKYMTELRALPAPGYIGSVHGGPVTDVILEWSTSCKGPFKSEEDFNATIAETYIANSKRQTGIGPFIRGMINAHKHDIVFTHGDLRPANIIVRDGRVAAIVDWELSGWYPEYWEFARAFYIETFVTDWASHLLGVLKPYYCEQVMYDKLMGLLW
ncbi:phosphotransferase enzyme family protein [Dothidotthia symphoricarpi CBS 119687]|uniref:Phosphotransferase enzyme family protein n=1 Tax=Dothidotthia symphoricarpi CBS 119687 TaxID=1392245 RepID=A0A6A6A421_9PLEO|nr:phosphotransferase enzyme family protein [Dothidotthia symphoricarpi CBS 119687]KAF2125864.1 phosphotransferase enzyme family protein [Dothidotthia symphoricarpi CBS 119687]